MVQCNETGLVSHTLSLNPHNLSHGDEVTRMRLSPDTTLFSLGGVPLVGNLATGGVIGLTREGAALCHELAERDVAASEVPEGCAELVRHLERGGYLEGAPLPRPRLRSAYLHVTQRCNLTCRLCYSEGDDRNRLEDPTLDELARAIGLLADLGCARLTVSGGEPFLRPDLADVARRARAAGIDEVVVLTNGLLLDEKNVAPLAGLVSCIAVAFDGTSPDAPAHLRPSQNFERLVAAVGTVRAAGIEARILPTLHAANLADMPRYERLTEELGASLGYSLLTAPARSIAGLALDEAQLRELGERSAASGLPGEDPAGSGAPALGVRRSCGAGVRCVSVAADGTVYPCHMLHDRRLAMGNAFTDSPASVMGSSVAATMRALDVATFEHCSSCDVRHLCGGGCRARALMATGDLRGRDPYCELSRAYYGAVGRGIGTRFGERG